LSLDAANFGAIVNMPRRSTTMAMHQPGSLKAALSLSQLASSNQHPFPGRT